MKFEMEKKNLPCRGLGIKMKTKKMMTKMIGNPTGRGEEAGKECLLTLCPSE